MNPDDLIPQLKQRLEDNLPGENAQNKFKTRSRSPINSPNTIEESTPSAVLILLFPKNESIHFFLTKRSQTVELHKGQISLPGGMQENNETLELTAIRETHEEIGVSPISFEILGSLTPLFTPVTGFMIHPFIAFSDYEPETLIQKNEVDSLHSVSLEELLNDSCEKKENRTINNISAEIPFFQFKSVRVWGVTAMILSEFKCVLNEVIHAKTWN